MASTNARVRNSFRETTHEGAPAARMTKVQALRRSVMSCLLWEREFYVDGQEIATRIQELAADVPVDTLASIAIEAREVAKLRHVPLLLLVALAKHGSGSAIVSETIARVIQRADELSEFLALYWTLNPKRADGRNAPLSAQVKLGLAAAFGRFDAYQIGKYDRAREVRLRDVLFLSHAKAANEDRQGLYKALVDQTLESPDTWEVALSAGGDKKAEFTRLLEAGKLGYLALLRNLRNMAQSGVDRSLVIDAIKARKGADRVLPFRYIAAARAAPSFEPALDEALIASIGEMPRLKGRTIVLVDVSHSMDAKLSSKSDLTRIDAAAALASIVPADDLRVFSFSNSLIEVPARKGMAGIEAITRSQAHMGTALSATMKLINSKFEYDRLIVITDEQAGGSHVMSGDNGRVPDPLVKASFMINVASAKNGVGYGKWTHIDGFSENVLRYIAEVEAGDLLAE